MRNPSLLFAAGLVLGACGGDDGSATTIAEVVTTTVAVTTTTEPASTTTAVATTTTAAPLSDPRFVETVLSARFGNPDPDVEGAVPPDVAGLLALFYRTTADQLVVVITGFADESPQCGWVLIDYGDDDVLSAESFDSAPWQSYANQPWATPGATNEPRCEEQFLEDGALRPDIAPAIHCGDYVVAVLDQMSLDPAEFGHTVATPSVDLIFDETAGSALRFPAVPWVSHPGANPTTADLGQLAPGVLDCSA
jgi:hypothetical protein